MTILSVMDEFSQWIQSRRNALKHCLTRNLKVQAFETVHFQRNTKLIKLVYDAYELVEDNEMFVNIIYEMTKKKKYKEVSNNFEINIFPCIDASDILKYIFQHFGIISRNIVFEYFNHFSY